MVFGLGGKGLIIRDAHYPGREPIDAYGNGGFRFADMSHKGSLLLMPSGIYGWDMQEGDAFTIDRFERVLGEPGVEFLLIGTGKSMQPVSQLLRDALKAKGMACDTMGTGAAVRTYNIMLAEQRPVAAALIAV